MENIQMNDDVTILHGGVSVRCFSCSALRTAGELTICPECGAGYCGSSQTKCNARCICTGLRYVEHPEDAKTYYSILDELNAGADPSRIPVLECQLELLEQRHGW